MAKLKYFRMILTYQILIDEELKEIKFGQCLLSFNSEPFVLFVAYEHGNFYVQKCNFACSFVWAWNLFLDITG
jgi:hypothetical protein